MLTAASKPITVCVNLAMSLTTGWGGWENTGNETSTQPVAIYLAQTSSETYYIKKLIFTKSVRTYPRLANADVELKGHLLSACSSISNSCFVKAKSMQQGNMPYLFSLQDIREFFSHTPSAADEI